MDPDMDPFIWVEAYSDPVGLERASEPSFDQVEKKPYTTRWVAGRVNGGAARGH